MPKLSNARMCQSSQANTAQDTYREINNRDLQNRGTISRVQKGPNYQARKASTATEQEAETA